MEGEDMEMSQENTRKILQTAKRNFEQFSHSFKQIGQGYLDAVKKLKQHSDEESGAVFKLKRKVAEQERGLQNMREEVKEKDNRIKELEEERRGLLEKIHHLNSTQGASRRSKDASETAKKASRESPEPILNQFEADTLNTLIKLMEQEYNGQNKKSTKKAKTEDREEERRRETKGKLNSVVKILSQTLGSQHEIDFYKLTADVANRRNSRERKVSRPRCKTCSKVLETSDPKQVYCSQCAHNAELSDSLEIE